MTILLVSNKILIDKIFQKQRKYTKLHDKQSYIVANNPIFELDRATKLKTNTGVERRKDDTNKEDSNELVLR